MRGLWESESMSPHECHMHAKPLVLQTYICFECSSLSLNGTASLKIWHDGDPGLKLLAGGS
jgi:hypothetical protein